MRLLKAILRAVFWVLAMFTCVVLVKLAFAGAVLLVGDWIIPLVGVPVLAAAVWFFYWEPK